jgi:para-aminobenzoate synthetase component I
VVNEVMKRSSVSEDERVDRGGFVGVVEELCPAPDAEQVFLRLAALPHCLYLDSARRDATLGRYSFVAADPFDFLAIPNQTGWQEIEAFMNLKIELGFFPARTLPDLPPFQGGAGVLFSYDISRQLEQVARPRFDEFKVAMIAVGLYDVVVAFDHRTHRAWIISQGLPETDIGRRRQRAVDRLEQFREWLREPAPEVYSSRSAERKRHGGLSPQRTTASRWNALRTLPRRLPPSRLRASYPVDSALPGLTSNFTRKQYLAAIGQAIEYIRAGDVFQVNLAQRLLHPAFDDSVALYLRLRRRNPATFGGYFDLGDFQIASASPERFLQVIGDRVEARPIKGTRRRIARPEADLFAGDELRESEKDNAENAMIVDLLRNDLSRVCRPESVVVSELCRLESYEFVQHLVSVVQGRLRDGVTPLNLLRAAFPGGSITGAPKIRAMQIIAELEPTARGPYCGSLGYIGFDGTMDTNILIRTITAGRGWWQMPVGGGIVAQSDPEREYEETWHKAEGLLRALR